ncbi:uncharacterized protein LOC128339987 isoform X1 [Hemicordylus capensis]|uniref:uncharacterized protein LOC128339987 isoform X1 n=1 Tax=Hemicordylus capensis TaxID=884348 RepID=UPI0023049478|nr:uncharacterized protein LOC128339987 isoform X1 [Hemicordylus capensis]XP_053140539.1 uncharacterized protein LOC128339987 isoform X1 [Hemicordylus capensis]
MGRNGPHKNRHSSRALGNQSGDSLGSSMHCTLISSDESELEDLKLGEELMVDHSTQTVWEDLSDTRRQSSRADWNQSGVSSMHCSLVSSDQSQLEDLKLHEELMVLSPTERVSRWENMGYTDSQSSRAVWNQFGDSSVSSMHCSVVSSDQSQLEDLKLHEELMVVSPTERVSRWEDMGYTDSQSSRAVWNQFGDSSVSSMHCSLFSSSSYQSEVEDCKVDEELIKIIHRLMEDREERANNQDEDVHFLAVLCACCKAAYKSGQETLDLPYTKGELIKAIVARAAETLGSCGAGDGRRMEEYWPISMQPELGRRWKSGGKSGIVSANSRTAKGCRRTPRSL